MNEGERLRHARVLTIPYQDFERWLNLPDGFEIVGVQNDYAGGCYELAVSCPREEKYEIRPGQHIQRVGSTHMYNVSSHPSFDKVRLYWPDLGQEIPEV